MKVVFHGIGAVDVDTPGDLHFANCLHALREKAPRCAGLISGEANIHPVKLRATIPDIDFDGDMVFEQIVCPLSCPRDDKSQKARCLIPYDYLGD